MKPNTVVLDGGHVEAAAVGGKADALNRLMGIGARVPPTGSITTDGYRLFVRESGLQSFIDEMRAAGLPEQKDLDAATTRVDEAFLEAKMPPLLGDEIRRLADEVRTGGLLAVRSSATAEDMAAASFAGQYRSFLEIEDDEALMRSVRLVWSSLWLPAPRTYRVHAGVPEDDLAMSVVVMRLVDARRAGVVFTVNPAGAGTDIRLEAVDGLAEQLVSGEVTPDAYVLPRASMHRPAVDPIVDEVIDAALTIERGFGEPQDVEWAFDGGELFIVQARPITTLPDAATADGFDTPIGEKDTYTTAGIAESVPGVLPPLQWTTTAPLLEQGFRRLFDQMDALPAEADRKPFLARVNGRAVLSLDLMKAAAAEVPGGSSEEIERQYFGRVISESDEGTEVKTIRGPFKGVRSMLAGFREINARRSFRFEAEASNDAIERLLHNPPDCAIAPTDALLSYRHRALDLAARVMAAEVAVAASAAAAYRGVELFLEPHVGNEAAALAQQLTAGGVDPCGAQVALHTCELAQTALEDEELSRALEQLSPTEPAVRELLAATRGGCELIEAVDRELGYSGSAAVFAGETWAESENLAWQLISQAVHVERSGRRAMVDPAARQGLLRDIEARFSTSWKWRLQRVMTGQVVDIRKRMLHRLVADAVEFLHLRERTKSAVLALGGEVRRIHLELGHRLHEAGGLDSPLDIDLVAAEELEDAFAGNGPGTWELRQRRKVIDHLEETEPIPQIFTGDPSRSIDQIVAGDGITFRGWAASAGVYEGPARLITKATQPIAPGDVLVARTTDPAWTPLFLTAGAIIVEEGGPLSHAAIIARELGLPAVLNVPGFLSRLSELEEVRVRVDGTDGVVRILDGSEQPAADPGLEVVAS
ncbi:MAG: PEP/pyruvate-binding domain-containing protein [Acidimicrobiia bacterium]